MPRCVCPLQLGSPGASSVPWHLCRQPVILGCRPLSLATYGVTAPCLHLARSDLPLTFQRDVFNQILIHAALNCTSSKHKNVAR